MASIRAALCAALGLALAMLSRARRQPRASGKYPDHPVKVVVGFTAGGGTDVAARVLAAKRQEAFGQSFVVENRPGASGLIGIRCGREIACRRLYADGRQPDHARRCTCALQEIHGPCVPKDFAGVSMIGISPLIAIVNPASPIKSIAELIAAAKSKSELDDIRLRRCRHHAAHGRRIVRLHRGHQNVPRRLSRRSAGRERSARSSRSRSCSPTLSVVLKQREGRHAARSRRHHRQAHELRCRRS